MKATRLVSLLVTAFLVALSPMAAHASYTPPGSGVSNNGSAPSGGGCFSSTFTVQGAAGDEITFELTGPDDDTVATDTKTADADGVATFTVEQCEPGEYTGTAFASDGSVLGSSVFVVPAGNGGGSESNGSGSASGGSDGNILPSTGSGARDMLALGGGLALVLVGGVAFVAARRRTA